MQAINNNDILLKALSDNAEAVIYALDATALVQESMKRLNAWPPATKHLGQSMMAAILLQALSESKDNEKVSLQWNCKGPFGHLYAEAQSYGEARGTILYPRADADSYDTNLGEGILQVRRLCKGLSTMGVVSSVGDVSTDLVEYLEKSEQRNCGVNFSVQIHWEDAEKTKFHVSSALAYLVHVLPQRTEQKMNEALLRWDDQMRALGPISQWALRADQAAQDMLRLISGQDNPNTVLMQRVKFFCSCSEERAQRALSLLNEGETQEFEITCEYCGHIYHIKPHE